MKKEPIARMYPERDFVPLQVKGFPDKLKRQVQAKATLENKTLKQVTIELYEEYLKRKGSC